MGRIRLGASACLLGGRVRFDGGHKCDDFLVESLGPYVEWVPVCPEVGMGLSTPRPALRLVDRAGETRLETRDAGLDLTREMRAWTRSALETLRAADLDGFVLKKDSPSCGLSRVKVYNSSGMPRRGGTGLFADALVARFPDLPVEEEGRMRDPRLREAFLERVFARRRLEDSVVGSVPVSRLVSFQATHKLQLMAHSPTLTREMGRLVARARQGIEATRSYRSAFVRALAEPATRGKHVNVLQHVLGFLRDRVGGAGRQDLHEAVDAYAAGKVPLIVPVSLLAHRARDEEIDYLTSPTYMDPYPADLGLRNAI